MYFMRYMYVYILHTWYALEPTRVLVAISYQRLTVILSCDRQLTEQAWELWIDFQECIIWNLNIQTIDTFYA